MSRMPSRFLTRRASFAAEHGLLLLDVVVDGAVGLHLLDLLEAAHRALDGLEIGQGAAQPALGDIGLAAGLGRFLDGLLGLLLGADEQDLAALADGLAEEVAGRLELGERLAEVDDVDAVARVEDEGLHLRVPAPGLVSEMDTRFQQFLNADADHSFLWLRARRIAGGPSRGTRDFV